MRFCFLLVAALFLAGCSSHRAPPPNARLSDSIAVIAGLNDQLHNWGGTLIATAACRVVELIVRVLCC